MGDKVETMKQQQPTKDPQQDETTPSQQQQLPQPQQQGAHVSPLSAIPAATSAAAFISTQLYIPKPAIEQQSETVNPKRPRYGSGQWKLLPSPPSHHRQQQQQQQQQPPQQMGVGVGVGIGIGIGVGSGGPSNSGSSPSPTNPQIHTTTADSSSSPTPSSPSQSPRPSFSTASGGDPNKPETEQFLQLRKGKYVSPVWKPNEMLWLARAWRVQYCGGDGTSSEASASASASAISGGAADIGPPSARGKTRAEKDREVAEFLNRHGVSRDAKTAGTKWDNMLGEFRKVHEWERGGEREQVGKSYFRLSPYERKIHRLPASFDEEVYDELSQFMGIRVRATQQGRGAAASALAAGNNGQNTPDSRRPLALTFKDDSSGMIKQQAIVAGSEPLFHRASFGFESSSMREMRRIGKIRVTWEESVSLWAEEGEFQKGRVKIDGLSFLNADELTFLDETMAGSNMEAFEEGPLRGFSVDRFICGQQLKVFGRRKPSPGFSDRAQLPLTEPCIRSIPPMDYQDRSEYYVGCLRVPPSILPSLFELSWHLQEPPTEDLRIPLRKDVFRDLPQGKELFFTTSMELLDCRAITYEILSPLIRPNTNIAATSTSRDSFIGIWDDCINRIISRLCALETTIVRKPTAPPSSPSSSAPTETLQDQWPNVTGFVRNFCVWRGEEVDEIREGNIDPSSTIVEKILWTYADLPYVLGYYAVGYNVTFCALSRSHDRVLRTDLYSVDLSNPTERLKALVPCWRISGLLPLLAERCTTKLFCYSDFEKVDLGGGNVVEMTPNTVKRSFSSRRKWAGVKEIYDFLDHRIPHAEYICRVCERDLSLVFKPRGCRVKPTSCEQLVEALKFVTKALVALHDLSFMHRDLGWEKVVKRTDRENEWFVAGFDEAVGAPQIYPHPGAAAAAAPEMSRGLHGVKVDVWGVGQLIKTCGFGVSKLLRELQSRCLDQNPDQRPTAADCYHHLLQLQSTLSALSY